MPDTRFFNRAGPFTLSDIVKWAGIIPAAEVDQGRLFQDVAPLDKAEETHISFFDNPKYLTQFTESQAGACFVRDKYAAQAPSHMICLICDDPYRAYALTAQQFYPVREVKAGIDPNAHIAEGASIHPTCQIKAGACVEAGAEIGAYTHIGPNAVIHGGVIIGESCHIGANSAVSHCLIGDRVIIHRNVSIGQDGFGFAMGRGGHLKVPQLGRVIIESDVEIGAGTCIDRGTGPDTFIGMGTKIDNLVQIGHSVYLGRHCVIVAQAGIAGSTRIGDGCAIGGQVGIAGHLKIGSGAKLAARTGVTVDLEAGNAYGGTPAMPIKDWHRQTIALNDLIKRKRKTE